MVNSDGTLNMITTIRHLGSHGAKEREEVSISSHLLPAAVNRDSLFHHRTKDNDPGSHEAKLLSLNQI